MEGTPRTRGQRRRTAAGETTPVRRRSRTPRSALASSNALPEAPPPSAVTTVDDSPAINSRKAISVSMNNNVISPRSAWLQAEQATAAREYNMDSPATSSYAGGTTSARLTSAMAQSPANSAISAARRRRSAAARRSTVDPYNDFSAYGDSGGEEFKGGLGGFMLSPRGKVSAVCVLLAFVFFNYPRARPWSLLSRRRGDILSGKSSVDESGTGGSNSSEADGNQAAHQSHMHLAVADVLNEELSRRLAEMERANAVSEQQLEEWKQRMNAHVKEVVEAQKEELQQKLAARTASEDEEIVVLKSKLQSVESELDRTREVVKHLTDEVKKKALREDRDDSVFSDYESVVDGITSEYKSSLPMSGGRVASKELAKTVLQLWRDVHLGGTGIRNWALAALGSTIVPGMTSPGLNRGNIIENILRRLSEFNPKGRYTCTTSPSSKPASVVLKSSNDIQPGDNFAFDGQQGNITINLGNEIIVESVGIEQPMPALIVDHSLAPKMFDVWGLPRPTFLDKRRATDLTDQPGGASHNNDSDDNAWVLLAKDLFFDYPENRLQIYPTKLATERCLDPDNSDRSGCVGQDVLPMRRVSFNIRENHGGAWTAVYRLRVHGHALPTGGEE